MSKMDIPKLNPCNSVINFLKNNNELGPNSTNNLCFQVCNDWLGSENTLSGTQCYNNCKDCMLPFIKQRGKDICSLDYKVPPIWKNIPSFFPGEFKKIMAKGDDSDLETIKKIAYKKCINKCKTHCKLNLNECNDLCKLDMDAIDDDSLNSSSTMKGLNSNLTKNNLLPGGQFLIYIVPILIIICVIITIFLVK